jgi:hypothetical protein
MAELSPLSSAQRQALADVVEDLVYYKPHFGRVFGMRNDTLDALERRGLVEILDEAVNPEARPIAQRHRVTLTAAGHEALEAAHHG